MKAKFQLAVIGAMLSLGLFGADTTNPFGISDELWLAAQDTCGSDVQTYCAGKTIGHGLGRCVLINFIDFSVPCSDFLRAHRDGLFVSRKLLRHDWPALNEIPLPRR
jgi:hypothetical protein